MADLFDAVAQPVAELLTPGAFLGGWRLMAVDGFEWDAPDTPANADAFGYAGGSARPSAFPKVRVVTLSECGSHAKTGAAIGPVTGTASYLSVVVDAAVRGAARERLLRAARGGEALPPERARYVRVIEYDVPDRGEEAARELICLLTTITDPARAAAPLLAQAYHQRWGAT